MSSESSIIIWWWYLTLIKVVHLFRVQVERISKSCIVQEQSYILWLHNVVNSLLGSLLMGFSKPSNVTASSGDWKCTLSSALGRLYNNNTHVLTYIATHIRTWIHICTYTQTQKHTHRVTVLAVDNCLPLYYNNYSNCQNGHNY